MNNIVTLSATWIDGESKRRRSGTINTSMDPDLIRDSSSLDEAIAHFRHSNPDLPADFEFDYFEINKLRYTWDELFLSWTVESSLATRIDRPRTETPHGQ